MYIAYIQTLSSIRRQIATADRSSKWLCPALTRLSCCSWIHVVPPAIPHSLPLLSPAHAQSFDSGPPVYTVYTLSYCQSSGHLSTCCRLSLLCLLFVFQLLRQTFRWYLLWVFKLNCLARCYQLALLLLAVLLLWLLVTHARRTICCLKASQLCVDLLAGWASRLRKWGGRHWERV